MPSLWSADEFKSTFSTFVWGKKIASKRFFFDDFIFYYFVVIKFLIWDQRELMSKMSSLVSLLHEAGKRNVHLKVLRVFTMWSIKVGLNII